jgi:hypothetical protein
MKHKPTKPATNTIGKGRKVCPDCTAKVGARSKVCQCGHEFSPKVEGWDCCKNNMIRILNKAHIGMDLVEIAVLRKTKPHPGCSTDKCRLNNKQLQTLLNELIKEGKVQKDGKKYKVIK